MYVFGPYVVGLIAGLSDMIELSNSQGTFAMYFLLPLNLLIYGINDIFDFETDKLNQKKSGYEVLVTPEKHGTLLLVICVLNAPFLLKALFFTNAAAAISATAFLFFSIFYSAPPIRAKTKPFLDSAFNVLYVLPGVFGYSLATGEFPPPTVLIAGGLWTAAMHAYSAIPDIEADREAKLSTIATVLGPTGTHIFCLAAYIGSVVLSYRYLGIVSVILGSVFVLTMIASMITRDRDAVFRIYRLFPFINAIAGFVLFWAIAVPKFFN